MGTWNSAPQVPNVPGIPNGEPDLAYIKTLHEYIKKMANVISILKNDLEFMINGNLDVKNIRAKSITADRMNVTELSAITANMGKLTSGEIYGAYIATAEGTYPRVEFSSTGDFVRALSSSSLYTEITPSLGGVPALHFNGSGIISAGMFATVVFPTLNIFSDNDIDLTPGTGDLVNIPAWSQLYSIGDSQTLQDALDSKAGSFSGYTGSFDTGDGRVATFSNGILVSVV